jgi:hypothetical protein
MKYEIQISNLNHSACLIDARDSITGGLDEAELVRERPGNKPNPSVVMPDHREAG